MSAPSPDEWFIGTLGGVPHIATLLGEINATWAFLEHSLPKALSCILNIPIDASEAILFALQNTSAKLDLVKLVAERTPENPHASNIVQAIKSIRALAKRRNIYVHHMFGYNKEGRVCRWDYRFKHNDQARRAFVTTEELQRFILEIRDAYNILMFAINPALGPPPSLQTPPQPPPPHPKAKGRDRPK